MDQTGQPDLFDTRLNATGKLYIRKFASAARILILVGVVVSFVAIIEGVIRVAKSDPSLFSGNKLIKFQYQVYPVYLIVHTVLLFLQLYSYWKVSKCLSIGVDYNDEITFNESFRQLYRNAVFGIIALVAATLMGLLGLYIVIVYYLN